MKKLTKQFLCLILVLAMVAAVPFGAAATVPMGMELYSMELTNGTISLYGRQFLKSGDEVVLTKGNTCLATAESAVDGTFTMEASVAPSSLSLSVDGKSAGVVDTSCFKSLFALMGTEYHSFALKAEYGRFVFSGAHKGKDVRYVTMNMVDTDGAPAALVETKSDADGNFSMEFYVKPGVYTMQLKARNLAMVSCSLDLRNFCMAPAETETIALLQQLEGYLAELETLKVSCLTQGIQTEYETINIEMIRKFIGFLKEEIDRGYTGSLGQYKFGLTRLYNQAKESMTAYLSGEAEPFSVPQYVTSDLTFDGTRVWADTMQHGERSRNLVYFNGFGHFDTANNDTEFFNKIGLNLIQSSMPSMAGCLQTEDWPDDWNGHRIGNSSGTFTETNNGIAGEEHAVLVVNTDARGAGKTVYMNQAVSVKPNTYYEYGFRAKGKAEDYNALNVCINDIFTGTRKTIAPSDTWIQYRYLYQTGAEDTLTLSFVSQYNTEGMYLDDVYLKEANTNVNLLKNGDFEKASRPITDLDREAMAEGYYIRYNSVENFRRILSEAEKNNVLVDVGVFPHFFPSFLEQGTQEDYTDDGLNEMHFTPFELDNERVRKAISIYARLVCSIVSEYDCVRTICLLNEPGLLANKVTETKDLKAHYTPLWQEFLMDRYGNDVRKLNENYGSNYQSFAEVDMPDNMEATPLYYDYRCFNDGVLADFHQWFAEELHNAYPQYKLHSKVQQYFKKGYETMHERGTNYELLAPFLDINGCDSFPTYASSGNRLSYKMAYYDFLTSLKKAPVWDSETHIIYDGSKMNYRSDQPRHIEADVWNGAVHGRSGGAYWLWDRGDSSAPWNAENRYAQANYAFRPEEAATLARTNMDLNRLAEEVSALQNSKAKTAILYSRTALGYGGEASMTSMLDAYESLIFSGQNVDFITDTTIGTIGNYQLLIVPDATHVKADMLSTIKEYLEQGGTLYIKGSDSLKKTEYNKNQETALVSAIYNHSNTVTDGEESLKTTVNRLALSKLRLVDAGTNEDIENVEWFYTEKDGKCLIHVMNHEANTTKQVKVLYENKPIKGVKELWSGTVANQFSAEFYQPLLLSFNLFSFDLVDENGTILEQDIDNLTQGFIRCRTAVEGDLILAIYHGDSMVQAIVNDDTIWFTPEESGEYRMMATVWELDSLKPLTQQRTMTYQIEEVQQ